MVDPLGSLLSSSWKFFRSRVAAIACAAVAVSIVMLLFREVFVANIVMPNRLREMGFDVGRIQELQQQAAAGDDGAADELKRVIAAQLKGMSPQMIGSLFSQIGPVFLIAIVVHFIVSAAVGVYCMLLVLEDRAIGETAQRTMRYVFPMIGLWIWLFLRTFAWIPIIGIIPAIILGPRFFLSGIFLVKEQKGVFESARLSYQQTKCYWGKIFGNMIVVTLILFASLIVVGMLAGMFTPSEARQSLVSITISTFVAQLATAFIVIFATKLGLSILEDTKKA